MGQGGSAISERGASWITGDDSPLVLQPMEGERHHLQQTAPPVLLDNEVLQSEQPLAGMTKNYYGHPNLRGSHQGNLYVGVGGNLLI
jgi:hypothetical protein